MPKKNEPNRKSLAASSLGQLAETFGVSLDTVKRWRAEGMPGESRRYEIKEIISWLESEKKGPFREKEKPAPLSSGEDPMLCLDADSPGLERYRLAKAKHAELDLENRKSELIDREKCREVLAGWAVLIRRLGEQLGRRHGPAAAQSVNKTLLQCAKVVSSSLGESNREGEQNDDD